jgi:RNA polymerase sigma-70 factor (ECF subfamily)
MFTSNTIAALKEGDELVFTELFNQYHPKVYFYILSKTRSEYIAEETTQLTFIKLWNYRSSLDESLPLSKQLFRIAKTTLIDILRKESSLSKLSTEDTHPKEFLVNDSDVLDAKELQQKVDHIVRQMPPVRRRVFELSRYESKSHKEIAQILSISVKTVENHIALAIKQLRRFLNLLLIWITFLFF